VPVRHAPTRPPDVVSERTAPAGGCSGGFSQSLDDGERSREKTSARNRIPGDRHLGGRPTGIGACLMAMALASTITVAPMRRYPMLRPPASTATTPTVPPTTGTTTVSTAPDEATTSSRPANRSGRLRANSNEGYQSAAMALEPSGNLQLQQHHAHDPRRHPREADQIVDRDRDRT
jgi:hypothetical protein